MSKIVENDKNLLKDALIEYNAIKEEAIKVAKDRLAKSMPDVIENYLKEELEKSMTEEGVISTDETMIDNQDSSVAETMKDVKTPMGESEDKEEDHSEEMEEQEMDEELTAEAIEEALKEIEDMKEGMYEEEEEIELELDEMEDLEEHGISFDVDFDDEELKITDIKSDDKEFDDVELELSDDEDMESDEESELELSDDEDMESDEESDEDMELDDIDVDSLEDEEDEMEEGLAHTMTHQNAKSVGAEGNTNYGKANRLRPAVRQESTLKKDVDKLIKENEELKSINVEFKEALKKYKTQLYEMAVFNANLSHVNNLMVEHTTTVDEKKQILNKFKSVSTIEESKKVYNEMVSTLNESKKSKKTIEEMVEKPTNGGSATSKTITESLNSNDSMDGIKAIKERMMYLESRRK